MNRGVNTTDFWTNQKAKSCFSSLQNYKETTQAEQLPIDLINRRIFGK